MVVQFFSKMPLEGKKVFSCVKETFLSLYGSVGTAKQKTILRQFNPKNNCLILQYDLAFEKEIESGLLFVRQIGSQTVIPKILFKTGILHKSVEKAGLQVSRVK